MAQVLSSSWCGNDLMDTDLDQMTREDLIASFPSRLSTYDLSKGETPPDGGLLDSALYDAIEDRLDVDDRRAVERLEVPDPDPGRTRQLDDAHAVNPHRVGPVL